MKNKGLAVRRRESLPDIYSVFRIQQVENKEEKLRLMYKCDNTFTLSVTGRVCFSELFEKIHKYAIFLSVKCDCCKNGDTDSTAGYAAMYANDTESLTAYISLICISKNYQRHHLGTALIQECMSKAQDAGMKQIRLEVLKRDAHAIRFYEACGFKKESNATEKSFYMRKDL